MRRAAGDGFGRRLRRVVVIVACACHDYVRAADDGKRTWNHAMAR